MYLLNVNNTNIIFFLYKGAGFILVFLINVYVSSHCSSLRFCVKKQGQDLSRLGMPD